jgi:hypothetical protein
MKNINRKIFFGMIGKGLFIAVISSAIPIKYFSNLSKKVKQQKINIVVHPSAIKRNDRV